MDPSIISYFKLIVADTAFWRLFYCWLRWRTFALILAIFYVFKFASIVLKGLLPVAAEDATFGPVTKTGRERVTSISKINGVLDFKEVR